MSATTPRPRFSQNLARASIRNASTCSILTTCIKNHSRHGHIIVDPSRKSRPQKKETRRASTHAMAQEVDFNEPVITTSDGLDKITIVSSQSAPCSLLLVISLILSNCRQRNPHRFTTLPTTTWSPSVCTKKTTR